MTAATARPSAPGPACDGAGFSDQGSRGSVPRHRGQRHSVHPLWVHLFYETSVHRGRVPENQSRLETLPPRLGGSVHPRGPRSRRPGPPTVGHLPARPKRRCVPGLWGPVQAWHPVHSARTPPPCTIHGPSSRALLRKLPTRLGQRGPWSVACPLHGGGAPPRSSDPSSVLVADLPSSCRRLLAVGGGQACFSALPGHQGAPICATPSLPAVPTCVQSAQKTGAPTSPLRPAGQSRQGPPIWAQVRGGHRPTLGRASPPESGSGPAGSRQHPAFRRQLGTPPLWSRTPAGGPAGSEGPQPGGGRCGG